MMQVFNPFASFIRPNNVTAYAQGQLVANDTNAVNVVPMVFELGNHFAIGQFRLTRARLSKTGTGVANASFRTMLFQSPPVVTTTGDGGVFANVVSNSADWIGNIDITSMLGFTDGAAGTGSFPAGSEGFLRLKTGTKIYALLQAQAAYTPAANEQFTLTLEEVDTF